MTLGEAGLRTARSTGGPACTARGGRFAGGSALALGLLGLLACQSPPDVDATAGRSAAEAEAHRSAVAGQFSSERAYAHLVALAEMGPRVSGTRGASRARGYLKAQLESSRVSSREVETSIERASGGRDAAVHVLGSLEGVSGDLIVLAAAYDTREVDGVDFVGANASGSGPAVVLELARALTHRQRPFTFLFAFVDADALPASSLASAPEASVQGAFPGSRTLARYLESEGLLERVRMAAFFQRVGDADLVVARDLHSHRVYRELFWQSAAALGRERAFPPEAPPASPVASHRAFRDHGLRQVIAIADESDGRKGPPELQSERERDTAELCSPESLAAVGEVTLEALDRIGARLHRIDHFRDAPVAQVPLRDAPAADAGVPAPGAPMEGAQASTSEPGRAPGAPGQPQGGLPGGP